jgi:hypothetical protein
MCQASNCVLKYLLIRYELFDLSIYVFAGLEGQLIGKFSTIFPSILYVNSEYNRGHHQRSQSTFHVLIP